MLPLENVLIFVCCCLHCDNAVTKMMTLCTALYCFAVQLAICIEKKRELSEDYQDCIGSEDQVDSTTEVTNCVLFLC